MCLYNIQRESLCDIFFTCEHDGFITWLQKGIRLKKALKFRRVLINTSHIPGNKSLTSANALDFSPIDVGKFNEHIE